MSDPFLAYQAPLGNNQVIQNNPPVPRIPNSINKSVQRTEFSDDLSKVEKEASSLGFAGGGAIAAIIIGVIAIGLAGTALHEVNDHDEDDHRFSKLVVGCHNTVSTDSKCSMVGGGDHNKIINGSDSSFIGGGSSNEINDSTENAAIIGGTKNKIKAETTDPTRNGTDGVILGGRNHILHAAKGIIAGGDSNQIYYENGDNSAIIGGRSNGVSGYNGGIFSGYENNLADGANQSGIFTGAYNTVSGTCSCIVGGRDNNIKSSNTVALGGVSLQTETGPSWDHATLCGTVNPPAFYPWDRATTPNPGCELGSQYRFAVGIGDITDENVHQPDIGFAVDNFGNLYFGGGHNQGGGTIQKGTCIYAMDWDSGNYYAKAFTIQHPIDEEKWLVHGCLEGPESGVYYRGKDIAPTTVQLPEYATKIADDFTVQITPIGKPRLMGSTEVNKDGFFDVKGDGKFHWHVTGTRLEIDVEPNKDSVTVNSWGPYTWNQKI